MNKRIGEMVVVAPWRELSFSRKKEIKQYIKTMRIITKEVVI